MLYQETREEGPKQEIDFVNATYTPYHPRARRLYKMLKEEFGITVIFKKTQTLGDIMLKKGRSIEKQYRKNILIYKFRPGMDQWMTLLGNKYLDPLVIITTVYFDFQ